MTRLLAWWRARHTPMSLDGAYEVCTVPDDDEVEDLKRRKRERHPAR